MDDLISRQAAIDMFQALAYNDWTQGIPTTWSEAYWKCAEIIRDMPIESQKTGRWIPDSDTGRHETRFMCSACGESDRVPTIMGEPIWRYCPWCGAKMEGGGE